MLNYEEIKEKALIDHVSDENYGNASYDLRVGLIISINGKEFKSFKIKPNSMVFAISKEKVKLPKNIIGHAYVKTSLSRVGIMANNIGIIDAEYDGFLSSVLINFGKDDYEIKEDDSFLRISFIGINTPHKLIDKHFKQNSYKEYKTMIKSDTITYLGNSFVNIDKVVKISTKEIIKSAKSASAHFAIWLAVAAILLQVTIYIYEIRDNKINDITINKVQNLQSQINLFNKNQILFLNIQKELKNNITSLKEELNSTLSKYNKLKKNVFNRRK